MTEPVPDRPDLRLVPPAVAGWAAAWLGTWGPEWSLATAGLAGLALAAIGLWRRSPRLAATALLVLALTAVGGLRAHELTSGPLNRLARDGAVVSAQFLVRGDPHRRPARGVRPAYTTIQMTALTVAGRGQTWELHSPVLAVGSGAAGAGLDGLVVGSEVALTGRLEAPERGSPLAAVVRLRGGVTVRSPPGPGLALVERVRAGLRRAVENRPDGPRALVPALVLGDTSRMTPELTAAFQSTGLTHLTAVSGANLTLLLAFLLILARWLGVRGWWLRGVGLAGIIVFVALCRTDPSVIRAAAMGLVSLAALGAGGRRAGMRNLAVAMVVLLLADPFLSRSLGFTLSVLASGGIIWWATRWSEVMNRWLPAKVAELVAVPLAAHLATLPVVAAVSGQVSGSGLLANALAGPLVGPATVLGFAAAGAGLVSAPLAAALGWLASWCAQGIIWIAQVGAALPGSSWRWPGSALALGWLGAAALLVALVMTRLLARPWLVLAVAVVIVVGLVRAPTQPGWPPAGWVLIICDVGQGDGLVLRTGRGQAVVIDTGPDPEAMRRCLDQLRIVDVPLLVLTHFHADHVDGRSGVWTGRRVGQVWVSPLASPAYEAAEVAQLAGQHGTRVVTPPVGVDVVVGEATLTVLGPIIHPAADGDVSSVENDASVVMMARSHGLRLLLTGDVEPAGQRAILASGADLTADLLKIPHHGSARQDPEFFAATHARVAVASAGADNDYGHPAPRTLQLARSLGMTVLHTDTDGGVAITASPLGVVTQR